MTNPAVRFARVGITYHGQEAPTLTDVDLVIDEGELVLVVGRTGSGKSTLLRAVNGSVPHFTGGLLTGEVSVFGRPTSAYRPRDLADLVGVVGQDPAAGFVTDTVEEELAYGMEQLALPPATMRKRVEETLDLLGIAELRAAPLRELSGGQQQRVAIGSVLTCHPRVLVLDEPTSALDPTGAEEVLATITRLVHDLSVTVIVAEHRLERVVQYADRVVHVSDGRVSDGSPADMMVTSTVAPPVVQLGRWAGWSPLPLNVRDARRVAAPLRAALEEAARPSRTGPRPEPLPGGLSRTLPPPDPPSQTVSSPASRPLGSSSRACLSPSSPSLSTRRLRVDHGPVTAVADVSLDLHRGTVTALMGRNGSGKSSLLWALQGSGRRDGGSVSTADGMDPAALPPARRRRLVGLVPQSASDLLYLDTVSGECSQADREGHRPTGSCAEILHTLAPGVPTDRHPRDLSEGQRLALVLAVQLTADPEVMLLDEPTRGLDYDAKSALGATLTALAEGGRTVVVATHDVEFAAAVASRVVVLGDGSIVADGDTADVVLSSPAFAPQVAKILSPGPWLTVADVRNSLPYPPGGRR